MFEGLQPWIIPYATWLYQVAQLSGLQPRVTSVLRSWSEQQILRDRWERGESLLYAARPGESKHQYGLAFDWTTKNNEALGALWQRMGGKWYPSDPVHFEV